MTKKAPGIIDVGGGVGHLSRLLSFGLDFQVTCLEAEGQFGTKALKIDEDLLKATKEKEEKRPKHVTLTVDPGLDVATFDEKFSGKHGIVGLHTCGDLGPTLVRLFAQSSKIETLQSVGCCYMHIRKCFPLSQNLQNFDLSYTSMELACHAIETYKDRLSNFEELEKLKVHNRRALLELILFEKNPELRKSMLKTVKNSHQMPFSEYVLKATEKLEKFDITSEDLENEDIQAKEMQWLRVVSFYTLRLLFAPLLETVLLLDRCLYLHENNLNCLLIPIFDPRLSPRNFVILSHK